MSYPPTGPDGGPPPAGPPQPPARPGEPGYPGPAGSIYGPPPASGPAPAGYEQTAHLPTEGHGGAPAPGGYGGAPAPGGYGGAPAPGGYGGAAAPGGYGPPGPGGYGGPPAPGGYGPPSGPASAPPFGGPVSGAPMPGPVPGSPVPAQQPYPGAQMSGPPLGQPMSGPPLGQPMSGPPGPGMPYGTPTPGAGRGKGQQVLVLAIVAGLLFALGGVMTGLYVAKSSEASRNKLELTAQLADRDGKVDANTKEIERLKADLQTANDKVKTVEQDLTGTQNARDEQARQKQVIAKCLDLLTRALAAPNRAAFDKLAKEADKACTEANKYL